MFLISLGMQYPFSSYTRPIPCMTSEKSTGIFVLRVFIWEKEISKILIDQEKIDLSRSLF